MPTLSRLPEKILINLKFVLAGYPSLRGRGKLVPSISYPGILFYSIFNTSKMGGYEKFIINGIPPWDGAFLALPGGVRGGFQC